MCRNLYVDEINFKKDTFLFYIRRNLYLYVDEINLKKYTFFAIFSNVSMVLIIQSEENQVMR